jgi:hypothetical protein
MHIGTRHTPQLKAAAAADATTQHDSPQLQPCPLRKNHERNSQSSNFNDTHAPQHCMRAVSPQHSPLQGPSPLPA